MLQHSDKHQVTLAGTKIISAIQDEEGNPMLYLLPWRSQADVNHINKTAIVSISSPPDRFREYFTQNYFTMMFNEYQTKGNPDMAQALQERLALIQNKVEKDKMN